MSFMSHDVFTPFHIFYILQEKDIRPNIRILVRPFEVIKSSSALSNRFWFVNFQHHSKDGISVIDKDVGFIRYGT